MKAKVVRWNCDSKGVPLASGFEVCDAGVLWLRVTFESDTRIEAGKVYCMRLPGEYGRCVRWSKSWGLRVDAALVGEYYQLVSGERYFFSVVESLAAFVPTFDYRLAAGSRSVD